MRLLVLTLGALLLSGCGGGDESEPDPGPARLTADRLVLFEDGSAAVVGIAARGAASDSGGCRPGRGETWDFFATRISSAGKVVRTDVIEEQDFEGCGDLVIEARAAAGGLVAATGWAVWPNEHADDSHGPVLLTFAADGSTRHDRDAATGLWRYGPTAYAETGLPGGGNAVMHARGYRKGLELLIAPSGARAVRVRTPALPADAVLYENWLYWYSLVADDVGVYGAGPYTRGQGATYSFPIFRHRLDGSLDRSFGGEGVVLAHPPRTRHFVTTQVAVDERGRVLAVGGADAGGRRITYVLRYLPNGRLDPTFGRAGVVRLDLGRPTLANYADTRAAIAVRGDGRILVAGGIQARGSRLWLLRPDGRPDRRFGRGGKLVLTPVP